MLLKLLATKRHILTLFYGCLCCLLLPSDAFAQTEEEGASDEIEIDLDVTITGPGVGDIALLRELRSSFMPVEKMDLTAFVEVTNWKTDGLGILSYKAWQKMMSKKKVPAQKAFLIPPIYKELKYSIGNGVIGVIEGKNGSKTYHLYTLTLERMPGDFEKAIVFKDMENLPNGRVMLTKAGLAGVYDFKGRKIIDHIHEDIGYAGKHFFALDKEENKTVYDQNGNRVYPTFPADDFNAILHPNEILLIRRLNSDIQPHSVFVDLTTMDTLGMGTNSSVFSDGYAVLETEAGTGVINEKGQFKMPPNPEVSRIHFMSASHYMYLCKPNPEYVAAGEGRNNKYFYALYDLKRGIEYEIDLEGYDRRFLAMEPETGTFIDGTVPVKIEYLMPLTDNKGVAKHYALLTKTGELIGAHRFWLSMSDFTRDRVAIVRFPSEGKVEPPKYGLINRKGKVLTSHYYREIVNYKGYFIMKREGRYGTLSNDGEEVVPPRANSQQAIKNSIDAAIEYVNKNKN